MNKLIKISFLKKHIPLFIIIGLCWLAFKHVAFINTIKLMETQTHANYIEIVVKKGETLWYLAQKYNNNNNSDIRRSVYEIKRINKLEDTNIIPGQIIKIPQ
ncbi:MAG: cell division suppressor protein YneA [Bacillota bacterium]